MVRGWAGWVALGSALGSVVAGDAAADAAACIASASVDRAEVSVGEQLVYRVHTLRRTDVRSAEWQQPPDFPGFRSFWLSERPTGESSSRGGRRYVAREERHALFPERAGRFEINVPALRCTTEGASGERTHVARAPALSVRVHRRPSGAPAGFDGLVGPVTLRMLITPREIRLGESVRVAVVMRGEGALWNARDPLGEIPGADVFRRRPEVTTEAGERLTVKRHFSYDVVPLRTGVLALPGLAVPFYDRATGGFATASAPTATIRVGPPRVDGEPAPTPPAAAASPPPAPRRADTGGGEPDRRWVAVVAALVCAGGLVALAARGRRAQSRRPPPTHGDGDGPDATSQALRIALARHLPGSDALTAEEICRHPSLPARARPAAELLAESDRARFDPRAAPPDRDRVERAIAGL